MEGLNQTDYAQWHFKNDFRDWFLQILFQRKYS